MTTERTLRAATGEAVHSLGEHAGIAYPDRQKILIPSIKIDHETVKGPKMREVFADDVYNLLEGLGRSEALHTLRPLGKGSERIFVPHDSSKPSSITTTLYGFLATHGYLPSDDTPPANVKVRDLAHLPSHPNKDTI